MMSPFGSLDMGTEQPIEPEMELEEEIQESAEFFEEPAQTAKELCPKEYKNAEKRKALGVWLTDVCSAAERQRKENEPRWDRLYSMYNGKTAGRTYQPYEGAADECLNFIQPRLDALAGIVVGTVTSQNPYCRSTMYVGDDMEKDKSLENMVFAELSKANYRRVLKKAALCGGWSNAGHSYVEYAGGKVTIKHKHPTEVLVYPSTVDDVADSEMYAVRKWRVKWKIDDMQESGYYFKLPKVSTTQGPTESVVANMPSTEGPTTQSPSSDLEPVGLWTCYFNRKGKWYGATLHRDSSVILRLWEYQYSTPCLQKYAYKICSEDVYWTPGSVANDLQGYQLTGNECVNMILDGLRASTFSTLAVPSPIGNDNMSTRLGIGDVVPVAGLDRATPFLANVNLGPVLTFISMLLNQADQSARVSALSSAGQLRPNTTATETAGVMQGQAESRDDYIETWSDGVEKTFAHVHDILSVHTNWTLPLVDEVKWAAKSTSPAATPESLMQILRSVFEIAAVPGSDIDIHSLTEAVLTVLERMGVVFAKDLQTPKNEAQQPPLQADAGGMEGMDGQSSDQILSALLQQQIGGGAEGTGTVPI